MGVACGSLACSAARVQTASFPWPDMDTWWSVLARLRVWLVSCACTFLSGTQRARGALCTYALASIYLSVRGARAGGVAPLWLWVGK